MGATAAVCRHPVRSSRSPHFHTARSSRVRSGGNPPPPPYNTALQLTTSKALALGCVCRLHRELLCSFRLNARLHGWVQQRVAGVDLQQQQQQQQRHKQHGRKTLPHLHSYSLRSGHILLLWGIKHLSDTGQDIHDKAPQYHVLSCSDGIRTCRQCISGSNVSIVSHTTRPQPTLCPCDTIQCH